MSYQLRSFLERLSHLSPIHGHRTKIAAVYAALGALPAGCDMDSIPFALEEYEEGDELFLEEACDEWGIPCHVALEPNPKNVVLNFVDVAHGENPGSTIENFECDKAARSARNSLVLRHEIGHLFGLPHVCEGEQCDQDDTYDGYLMHGNAVTGDYVSPDEYEVVYAKVDHYLAKCF